MSGIVRLAPRFRLRDTEGVSDLVPEHVLVLYENSPRGDAAIREAVAVAPTNARLTVVTVAVIESGDARCCDTRAGYWNGVVRELAGGDLDRARSVIGDGGTAVFKVLTGKSALAALAHEVEESRADLVVVPSGRGIHPWFRARRARQLRRRARDAVVVSASAA